MNGMLAINYHKYTTKEMNESTLACLYCNLPMKKELVQMGYAIQHTCLGCGHREIEQERIANDDPAILCDTCTRPNKCTLDQVTQCSLYHRSIPSLKRSD